MRKLKNVAAVGLMVAFPMLILLASTTPAAKIHQSKPQDQWQSVKKDMHAILSKTENLGRYKMKVDPLF